MNKELLLVLIILLLELISDVAVVLWLGGWSVLVLPFMIFLQIGFDFILIFMLGIATYYGKTNKTKVVK